MSARDDYPPFVKTPLDQWQEMCDEIDRLRTEVETAQKVSDADEQTMLVLMAENHRLRERIRELKATPSDVPT